MNWEQLLAISNLPDVDEALRAFLDSPCEDNAVGLVQVILEHRPACVKCGEVSP